MFKTVFRKLVFIYIAIVLIGFSIAGGILYYLLTNVTLSNRTDMLLSGSKSIGDQFKQYVENMAEAYTYKDNDTRNYGLRVSQGWFEEALRFYSDQTSSIVWIVDKEGHVLFSKPGLSYSVLARMKDDSSGSPILPDKKQYSKVFSLKNGYVKEIGNFYGLFRKSDFGSDSYLTIEVPLTYRPTGSSQDITIAIYLHTSVSEIQTARTSVIIIFFRSVTVALIISILLIYIFSIRFTSPLKQMNKVARVIANGEFDKRVSVNSRDEIGELASSFNYMVTALQKLEDMRRGFIANVSHELRTPMTSIRGFVEGILDGTIPQDKQSYYLMIVRDETNRLNRLVNDLLDLARMEAGEVKLNQRSFNINELIRRCVIKMEGLIVQKDIQVNADLEQEDIFVYADPDAIERVIINLVHNAVKFTPEKGIITIGTATQKDKVTIWVQDTGIGIEKEEIDFIWDRFYKSDKSRSRDKTGTGLGLAIIKNLINEHKQRIWVESEPGKGTKFTFTLERVANPEKAES